MGVPAATPLIAIIDIKQVKYSTTSKESNAHAAG